MPLPDSRNTTYTPSDPIKSVDLNELQDCIVNHAHGDLVVVVGAIEGADIGASGTFNENPLYWKAGVSVDLLTIPLPLKVGDQLKSITHVHWSGGAGSKEFEVYKQTSTGAYTLLVSWGDTYDPADGSVVTRVQTGTAYKLLAGEKLYIRYITSHVNDRYYQAVVTFNRPPP